MQGFVLTKKELKLRDARTARFSYRSYASRESEYSLSPTSTTDFTNSEDASHPPVVGTNMGLTKDYLRLTSEPDPRLVRPVAVLEHAFQYFSSQWAAGASPFSFYLSQLKSMRQDLAVQRVFSPLVFRVYEANVKIAALQRNWSELNQCLTCLHGLYQRVITILLAFEPLVKDLPQDDQSQPQPPKDEKTSVVSQSSDLKAKTTTIPINMETILQFVRSKTISTSSESAVVASAKSASVEDTQTISSFLERFDEMASLRLLFSLTIDGVSTISLPEWSFYSAKLHSNPRALALAKALWAVNHESSLPSSVTSLRQICPSIDFVFDVRRALAQENYFSFFSLLYSLQICGRNTKSSAARVSEESSILLGIVLRTLGILAREVVLDRIMKAYRPYVPLYSLIIMLGFAPTPSDRASFSPQSETDTISPDALSACLDFLQARGIDFQEFAHHNISKARLSPERKQELLSHLSMKNPEEMESMMNEDGFDAHTAPDDALESTSDEDSFEDREEFDDDTCEDLNECYGMFNLAFSSGSAGIFSSQKPETLVKTTVFSQPPAWISKNAFEGVSISVREANPAFIAHRTKELEAFKAKNKSRSGRDDTHFTTSNDVSPLQS